MTVDLLIKGGMVVDGSGLSRFRGDVAVTGGVIVEVGHLGGTQATQTIDAGGCVVAPGFIDPHTHLDPQLCWDPFGLPSILHGVTTVITGNCSVTIAPCRPEHREAVTKIFHLLEEVPLQTIEEGVDWSWETFGGYLDRLDGATGINIGALVGHSALRYFVMGEAAYDRAATGHEVEEMRRVLRASMQAGAIGLSTSNSSFAVGDGGRPIPSRQAEVSELFALCDVLGELNAGFFETDGGAGTFDFPHHVRTVAGPIAMRTGRPAVLGSTVYESSAPNRWREVLAAIEDFQHDGARVFAQTCPGPIWVNFTMERPLMFEDLPSWHEVFSLPSDAEKLAAYRRPEVRDAMQFDGVDDTSSRFFSRDWGSVTITEVGRPANRHLVGQSVQAIADARRQRVIDTLLDLVIEEGLATRFLYPAANSGNDEAVAAMMRSPQSIIGSSDAGAHLKTLCGAGDTSLLLSRWVRERQQFTLEEAIRLVTFDQASVLGLSRRGLLREGYAADIVIFDPAAIEYLPARRVSDLPGGASRLWRDATGIAKVIVNGRTVVDDGEITGELAGRVFRGNELC